MKTRLKILCCIGLIITLITSSCEQISGQKKATIVFGVGFPELMNIGIKYQIANETETGFNIGYWPPSEPGWFYWTNLLSLSGEFYYHFAGVSDFSTMRPWYARIGLNIIFELPSDYPVFTTDTYLRIGRDFYIDEINGISLDGGFGVNLYVDSGFNNLFPALGIKYFHRF